MLDEHVHNVIMTAVASGVNRRTVSIILKSEAVNAWRKTRGKKQLEHMIKERIIKTTSAKEQGIRKMRSNQGEKNMDEETKTKAVQIEQKQKRQCGTELPYV